MRRGQPGNPYKTALAALKADVVGWQRQITATEALIADLTVRAEGGTRGTVLDKKASGPNSASYRQADRLACGRKWDHEPRDHHVMSEPRATVALAVMAAITSVLAVGVIAAMWLP